MLEAIIIGAGLAALFFAIAFIFRVVDMILDDLDDIERRWPKDK